MRIDAHVLKTLPMREKRITVSTGLTLLRILLCPFILFFMREGLWKEALFCLAGAALSDLGDGMMARWRNEQTILGACLDPIADKIVVLSCFFTLTGIDMSVGKVPAWFAGLLALKELLLIIGIVGFYKRYGYVEIRPTFLSKITTVVQMGFIGWLLACQMAVRLSTMTALGHNNIYMSIAVVVLLMAGVSLGHYGFIGMRLVHNK